MLKDVLTISDVAKYLRVNPKTVYALVREGKLPSFRVGRHLRCKRSDVEFFIDSQRGQGSA